MTQAVIEFAGKQHLVSVGDKLSVTVSPEESQELVTVDKILLLVDDGKTLVGQPYLEGHSVELKLDKVAKGDKIRISRFKAKSRHRRVTGFRPVLSHFTVAKIITK